MYSTTEEYVRLLLKAPAWHYYVDMLYPLRYLTEYIQEDKERVNSHLCHKLERFFGDKIYEDPEYFVFRILKHLNSELKEKHDLFDTYKICYAIDFLNKQMYMDSQIKEVNKNIKFVKRLLYKVNYSNFHAMDFNSYETNLFNAVRMLKGHTLC